MAVTRQADASDIIEVKSPATGEIIGTVPNMDEAAVRAAVARARDASGPWGSLGHAERGRYLADFRRGLAARADELAASIHLENGKPRLDAILEVAGALGHLKHAAERASRALRSRRVPTGMLANFRATISYHPLGVIGIIGPWNYPIFTPMGSIAFALAAGNAVVFKPSEYTPMIGELIAEVAASTLPPGVFELVTGDGKTGGALARADVDKIAFTGSTATGRRVMQAATERLTPVLLELGGKDPMIVGEDADLDRAAAAAVFGAFSNAGQACVSIERVYVVDAVYSEFVDKVVAEAKKVRWGADDDAEVGPITMARQVDIIREHLEDAVARGATCLVGGPAGIVGSFVPPTVLTDVSPDMKVMREETFGPVLPIARVASVEDALEAANATRYGLGSAVFGRHAARVAGRIRSGMTAIDAVVAFSGIAALPFGGVGESGFGRIHGDEGLREFSRTKSTAEKRFHLPVDAFSFAQPANMVERTRGLIKQLYGGGAVDLVGTALRRLTGR